MRLFIGLEIGGTKSLAGAADEHGNVLRRIQQPTPRELEAGLSMLQRMVAELAGPERPAAIGAAIGGPLDWRTGVVSPLHQPAWRNVPLKALMEERWRCPFHVDVDTNVAALGEWLFGGEEAPRLLYLTLGTGMGGGFLVDGRIYRGVAGAHPEAGHQSIPFRCAHPERVACECGVPDCLEALVSGNGIRRVYGKPAEQLSGAEWDEVAFNLGQGLRNLAALYAPDVIALGGGVALGGGEAFIAKVRAVMEAHLRIVPPPKVRLSRLGAEAGFRGAVGVAMRGLD